MADLISPALTSGLRASLGMPPPIMGNLDIWLADQQVQDILRTSETHYRELEDVQAQSWLRARLDERLAERRRADYVQAQQNTQTLRPNYTDPEQIRRQVADLVRSM